MLKLVLQERKRRELDPSGAIMRLARRGRQLRKLLGLGA
jgi:hypothetical protein